MKKISLALIIAIVAMLLTCCSVALPEKEVSIEAAINNITENNETRDIVLDDKIDVVIEEKVAEDIDEREVSIESIQQVEKTQALATTVSTDKFTYTISEIRSGEWRLDSVTYDKNAFTTLESLIIHNPSTNNIDYNIVEIGQNAFRDCNVLSAIDLTNLALTKIGPMAFYGCKNLATVKIPTTVTNIEMMAFEKTPWVSTLRDDYGLAIVNNILIDGYAAQGEVTIPTKVTKISPYAFAYNSKITAVSFIDDTANTIENIPWCAFYDCDNLIRITIPKIKYIDNSAFSGCKKLQEINSCNVDLREIKEYAFKNCVSLKELDFTNSASFEKVGNSAFFGCKGLTTVTFSSYLKNIEYWAFASCTSLTSVDLGIGNTNAGLIKTGAFAGCEKLTSISLPTNFTTEEGWFK